MNAVKALELIKSRRSIGADQIQKKHTKILGQAGRTGENRADT